MRGIATVVLPNRPDDINTGALVHLMSLVYRLARNVALHRDRDRALQVSDISSDILDSMYCIRF